MSAETCAEQVQVFDTTLRDGDQTPGVNFTIEDKITIAGELEKLGVDIIEAGFPISTEGDFEAVHTIAETLDGPVICALARATDHDIEAAAQAIEPAYARGGGRIHTFIGTSPLHMEHNLHMTPEEVRTAAGAAVTRAKLFTEDVEFSPEDASRSDFDFMMSVIMAAVDAGATTINIPDTVGRALPHEYAERIQTAKGMIDERMGTGTVVVSAHCHDDLGLATANTIAAVEAGARQIEVVVGGFGERAGNTSLEQTVAILRERYGNQYYTAINTAKIYRVAHAVMNRAGIYIPPSTAITGDNAFAHTSGIHQKGVLEHAGTYEHIRAESYGQTSAKIVLGKTSGKGGVESHIKAVGMAVEPRSLISISKAAKALSDENGRNVADTDVEQLVAAETGAAITDRYILSEDSFEGNKSGSDFEVSVRDMKTGAVKTVQAQAAEGVVTAAARAINEATGSKAEIVKLRNDSTEIGTDSPAGAFVVVKEGDAQIEAYSQGPSVDSASIAAYLKAVNLIERMQERKIAA